MKLIPNRPASDDDTSRWNTAKDRVLAHVGKRREIHFSLATREIAGYLQLTEGGIFAWYVLGPQNWDFLSLPQRIQLWDQQTYRHASLAAGAPDGVRPFRLRITSRPYPAFEYARSLDEATPSPLPQVDGGESWNDYLGRAQMRLASTGLDTKLVMQGIWVAPPPRPKIWAELVDGTDNPSAETAKIIRELHSLNQLMAGPGFDATPATPQDLAYLFHRSLSMGIPAPLHAGVGGSRWSMDDLAEFTERRTWTGHPYGRDVEIISEQQGRPVKRNAVVMSVGVMPDQTWPENGRRPWMLGGVDLPFAIEWSVSGAYILGSTLEKTLVFEHNRAQGIASHYAEHHQDPPPAVARSIAGARANLDEATEGDTRVAARMTGTIRLAVTGTSDHEAWERAQDVTHLFGEELKIPLHMAKAQAEQLREFIPGEPHMKEGYQRRMPVRYLAAGMPNVDNELGTPSGFYIGYGSGSSRRAVRFDPHFGMEKLNKPGLFPVVAEPGGGKSVFLGSIAYNAVRAGEDTIILDPSGPLAELAKLPELAPYSKVIDLTSAEPGTLSPYQMVPEPRRGDFDDEDDPEREYQRAVKRAHAERQQLMFDVLRQWLPVSLLRQSGTDVVLREGLAAAESRAKRSRTCTSDTQTNPRWVIEAIAKVGADGNELAESIGKELAAAADFPLGELIVPGHSKALAESDLDDRRLVIITMPGLSAPPSDIDKEFWGAEERYTQPLLHLAAFFASRFIYSRPRDIRKNILMDENQLMSNWGSGRAFFVRLSRDSRKWNTSVFAGSQHPDDHLSVGRTDALMGGALVGRLTDATVAEKACRLVHAPKEYAAVIQALSPIDKKGGTSRTGEFVLLDPLGRIGKLRIDMDWHPSLAKALNTTPGRRRAERDMDEAPMPFIDPELFEMIDVLDSPAIETPHDSTPEPKTTHTTVRPDFTPAPEPETAGAVA